MLPFLQLTIAVVIMILAAKASGYLSYRLGQPSVLGELVAGLILGPTAVNFLHLPFFTDPHIESSIHHFAEFGVLFLMFMAGLDLHLSDLLKSGKISAFAGVLGFLTPLGMGYGMAALFAYELQPSVFLGMIIAATSVSISAQTLMELGKLRSRVGISLLGAAVVDDVLVVLGLSIFIAVVVNSSEAGLLGVALILLRMVGYLVISVLFGLWALPRLTQLVDRLPISQGTISFVIVTALFYAWTAEVIGGMAAITGAFLAGLLFARSPLRARIGGGVSSLAYGFFVPIFFINIGLSADLFSLSAASFWLMAALSAVAVVSKLIGSGLGGRFGGLTNKESIQLGMGMISRGEVGLIVASVGIEEGLIGGDVFAAVVGMVIITTLITPPLLRSQFTEKEAPRDPAS